MKSLMPLSLVSDDKLREQMGKMGRKRVEEEFDWKMVTNRVLQHLQEKV